MTYRFRAARTALARDPGHLPIRDRAVLRILNRTGAATVAQLTILAYRNRRLAQARLRRLWEWGYLERTTLPPAGTRGGAPYAYRLAPAAARRLGYATQPLARTRLPRPHARRGRRGLRPGPLRRIPRPTRASCSGCPSPSPPTSCPPARCRRRRRARCRRPEPGSSCCLEIDEGNQHAAPIRDKLRAYRRALDGRPGWHVLFVVPTADRAAWLRRAARGSIPTLGPPGSRPSTSCASGAPKPAWPPLPRRRPHPARSRGCQLDRRGRRTPQSGRSAGSRFSAQAEQSPPPDAAVGLRRKRCRGDARDEGTDCGRSLRDVEDRKVHAECQARYPSTQSG